MRAYLCTFLAVLALSFSGSARAFDGPYYYRLLGRLQSEPLLQGIRTLRIDTYDQESGGSALYSNFSDTYLMTDGVFNDTHVEADPTPDTPRFHEMEYGGEVLGPRREVLDAPYALNALRLDGLTGDGFVTSGGTVTGDLGVPSGQISLGPSESWAKLTLYEDVSNYIGLGAQDETLDFLVDPYSMAMTLTDEGQLGVGIPSPEYTLDVGYLNGATMALRKSLDAGARRMELWQLFSYGALVAFNSDLYIQSLDGDLIFQPDQGNVSIGSTESHDEKLHVTGAIRSSGTSDTPSLRLVNTEGMEWRIVSYSDGNLNFWNGGNRLSIDSTGQVGVGDPTPEAKLHVNGDLNVEGVIEVTGQSSGFFPKPAYASNWFTLGSAVSGGSVLFYHNLGGNADDYIVELERRSSNLPNYIRHNRNIGTDTYVSTIETTNGYYYEHLTNTTIRVTSTSGSTTDSFRFRIWR